MSRIWNFSAGPGALPDEVRARVADALGVRADFAPSIVELSHRGPAFTDVAVRLRTRLRAIMELGDDHEILLMAGGAQLQFALMPMNLAAGRTAAYIDSGHWSRLAIEQAGEAASIVVAGSGVRSGYTSLPAIGAVSPNCAYLHYCGNETAHGVQFPAPPEAGDVPLVADLSSEILSRPYDFGRLGMIYACAQKNLGIAGLTVVVIRRDLLERSPATLPPILSYREWARSATMPNTPCTIAWYVTLEMLEWVEREGGVAAMAARNAAKAAALYACIDRTGFYVNQVDPACRSTMNVVFRLADRTREPAFLAAAGEAGLVGLEGHRAVGGIRVSLYNAVPMAAVEQLVAFMDDFARRA